MWGTDLNIVVVDDDPGCRELHRHWLAGSHSVETAASGRMALESIDEETDLVLLDREMPGLMGDEVVSRLREGGYEGFVIMVTGVRPDFDLVDMQIDDYLVKPISERELQSAIDRVQSRDEYHDQLRALFSLAAKKARLELEKDKLELAQSDEYSRLEEQLAEKRAELSTAIDGTDEQWEAVFEACVTGPDGTYSHP